MGKKREAQIQKHFGNRVRELRKEKELSQEARRKKHQPPEHPQNRRSSWRQPAIPVRGVKPWLSYPKRF
jgi:hypothetical protein